MGVFNSGFRTTADYFMGMFKNIEANPAEWGCKLSSPLLPHRSLTGTLNV